jgi:ubiquinone/menaquinone biosynthesis C-methylase UbiE
MSSTPSPLATPAPWEAVAGGYAVDIVPQFEKYARDALRVLDPPPRARLLDVACGPGTVALLAAREAEHVDALDFAPAMIEGLRGRAASQGVSNVEAHVGDAQELPFGDDRYDGALSMFGFIFFPDRPRAFRELLRVLKPGARAVVSSWAPPDQVPAFAAMFGAMAEELPMLKGGPKLALTDPADLRAEMEAAGFRDVAVHEVAHRAEAESVEAFWESNLRSSAPIAIVRKLMDAPAFGALSEKVTARMRASLGTGRVEWDWVAYLGVGRK